MKKLLLTLLLFGFGASCVAREMTNLTVNNQTNIGWKIKIEAKGKWISDWKLVSKKNSISFDIDAKTFTAQLRSQEHFKITAMTASKDIVLRKDFKNVSGKVSITIKEGAKKAAEIRKKDKARAEGKYYIE